MKTPRDWTTVLLMAAPTPRELEPGGNGISRASQEIENLVRQIEDAVLERSACIADQDPENKGRIANAIRSLRHFPKGVIR